jgi:hypothetical protein
VRYAHGVHLLRLLRGSVALESETGVEGCSPPESRCGSALSLPRKRLARRIGTSATPQETALSGAFFRLSSGCLSTRLRREQSRQQLVSCSFPRETWARAHLRETRLGPNVPVFLVGLRKAALLGSPHRWLGIGLRVSLCLSFRSSEGSSLRPSLILLFGRSAAYFNVGFKCGHSALTGLLALRRSKPTLCHPLLFITYRGAVDGLRSTLSTLTPRAAVQLFLSCLQLPLRAPAALSCLFGSLFLLLPAVSATPFSPTPKAPGSTHIGGFLKKTTTRNREFFPASSSCLRDSILADAQGTRLNPYRGIFKENHYA